MLIDFVGLSTVFHTQSMSNASMKNASMSNTIGRSDDDVITFLDDIYEDKEHDAYINAVKDFLRTRYRLVPRRLALDIFCLEPLPIQDLFEAYMASFPCGTFALVYNTDSQAVATKFRCMIMLRMEGPDDIEYEFVVQGNHIVFRLYKDSIKRFMNTITIRTKHTETTIHYSMNVDIVNLDTNTRSNAKALSVQLFR